MKNLLPLLIACCFISTAGINAQDIRIDDVSYKMVEVESEVTSDGMDVHYFPGFYIGETEVTIALWCAVMNGQSGPSLYNYPISGVTLEEIDTFIDRLNTLTGHTYRLPTSFEWQYAFQEGKNFSQTIYSGSNTADNVAWYRNNSKNKLQPVAQKQPNALGIYDLSGNVAELCRDGFTLNEKYYWYNLGGDFAQEKEDFKISNANIRQEVFDGVLPLSIASDYIGFRLVCDSENSKHTFPTTYLTANQKSIIVSNEGETKTIEILTDGKTWDVSYLPDWCKAAKSKGGILLTIIVGPNDGEARKDFFKISSGTKEVLIQISQAGKPATYIKTDTESIAFKNIDDPKIIQINTDGSYWKVEDIPDWCSIEKQTNCFTITCAENKDENRSARIKIISDSIEKYIQITQTAGASYLYVDINSLSFPASGESKFVTINTDAEGWKVTAPWWCQINRKKDGFTVSTVQTNQELNPDFIKVSSGHHEVQVQVAQDKLFNSPGGEKRLLGISAGYVGKQWKYKENNSIRKYGFWDNTNNVGGLQIGIRLEPLFKYGFGLNTGLFWELYYSKTGMKTGNDDNGTFKYYAVFSENSFYIPVHLEYRLHFSKDISLFFYVGAGFDIGLQARVDEYEKGEDEPYFTKTQLYGDEEFSFYAKRFNASIDFGTGIRIYNAQLNVGMSNGLINQSPHDNLTIKQNKNLMISLSWMLDK